MSELEWDQLEAVLAILHPFAKTSIKMQATTKPVLGDVFCVYETLFDTLDQTFESLRIGPLSRKPWSKTFGEGVSDMFDKLKKHYDSTSHPFAYSDAVLLNPKVKTELFERKTFKMDNWKQIYLDGIRKRYKEYELNYPVPTTSEGPRKRQSAEMESDSDSDVDILSKLVRDLEEENNQTSEIDTYLLARRDAKLEPLDWWRVNQTIYPQLARMVRDIYAVPATGAGVEREFSKSGRVASTTRARLNPITVEETMRMKDRIRRYGSAKEKKEFLGGGQ